MKFEYSVDVLNSMNKLAEAGGCPKWGSALHGDGLRRRNVFLGELKRAGVQNPEAIAKPSVRNDASFLFTVVGVTSVIAVAGGFLPGDWGFFVPYLTGGICLVVLAVGSTAPGLLQLPIDLFSSIFPDYRQRVLRHEAAHFLIGYLLGIPVTNYSLQIGKAHTDFAEAKIQMRLIERKLTDDEINTFAVMSMAGVASEGINYPDVMGQTADLMDLQRILARSQTKLSAAQEQNMTRWAVYKAAQLLRNRKAEYEALQQAMASGASVAACVRAIEEAGR
ncbi:hypothetical protein WJX72_000520 [[Myrmecia] bisecta]|uniref:Uncharacterized protein n=1 Tax=[Myrmecia] bisecta TaxID=41462 RepID=A0AAW1R4U7_9CHLO